VVSSDGAIWFTDPLFGNLGNYEAIRSSRAADTGLSS
jgi:hypothetical protein